MGATIGVIAALLFGTEEGRKVVKEVLGAIPEKYKKVPEAIKPIVEPIMESFEHVEAPRAPIITPTETPHHATYDFHDPLESPPPAPPAVHPYRPL